MEWKCLEKISRRYLYTAIAVLLLIIILLVAAVITLAIITAAHAAKRNLENNEDTQKQEQMGQLWEDTKRSRHCVNSEYLQRHPPLLVLSLDGLVNSLLEHFDSLRKLGNLGVSTKAVYSSIPESNFTNSIAIATGLYSRWQGLEDSSRDRELNMTNADDIKPIWQRYKEQTNGIAALHSWPLGPFEAYRPDYYVAGNGATLLEDQLTMALRWLRMEATLRPGLVMIRSDGVRKILETAENAEVAKRLLLELNDVLSKFFAELFREGILECMNIVIISDEGITRSAWSLERIDKSDYDEGDPERTIASVYGTNIVGEGSSNSNPFCLNQSGRRIFLASTLPLRLHSNLTRNRDAFLFLNKRNDEKCRNCREMLKPGGRFDLTDERMQTIFFAQGMSFRRGSTLPPFHNTEYMNLWLVEDSEHFIVELFEPNKSIALDLLNMTYVPNNGTIGLMDDILVHPVKRERHIKFGIRECPFTNEDTVVNCGGCTAIQLTRIAKWMSSCVQPNRPLVLLSSSSSFCYKKICEKLIVKGASGDDSLALVEVFHPNNAIAKSETPCRFVSSRYRSECPDLTAKEGHEFRSLSANPKKVLARVATIQVLWKSSFITAILDPLNEYTLTTSRELGRLICITGTAYDRDFDGIADKDRSGSPTHLYRILIACPTGWSEDGFSCKHPLKTKVLTFVFPHVNGDPNCLPFRELLLQYTARLRDVELLAGMEVDFPGISASHALHLKVYIASQLW